MSVARPTIEPRNSSLAQNEVLRIALFADTKSSLTQAYLSGIEREKRNVSLDNIQKIALALETTGSALLKRCGKRLGATTATIEFVPRKTL